VILIIIFFLTCPLMASLVIGRRQMEISVDHFPTWSDFIEGMSIRKGLNLVKPSELTLFFSLFVCVSAYISGQVEFSHRSYGEHAVLVEGEDAYIVAATRSGIIYSRLLGGAEIGGVTGSNYLVHFFKSYDGGLTVEGKYYAELYGDEVQIESDWEPPRFGPQ
jgi:hypothetical protein